jgi:hypothetical protein
VAHDLPLPSTLSFPQGYRVNIKPGGCRMNINSGPTRLHACLRAVSLSPACSRDGAHDEVSVRRRPCRHSAGVVWADSDSMRDLAT